ncbi:diguanylate cyclase (GGDEF)-like protein/PAS domain S-box-containing protein [Aminobacter lissarensis]|uniref:Diguanylate cyclase (GGDEF)-like protein/PAS domain S-box-containing protein n=1 Tax=Aminobacter carboxidus TaxID=376165 RepID=A0A8E1WKS2_9HYPH|nr:diguanylate cyclase [Aminobacter lissarensis]MBB6468927.1 diguanylate cyclase (GGDEF)-like protein/PAS domain S-box-containing protein [Aminobacter lissarensis]
MGVEKHWQGQRNLNSYLIALALACLLPVVAVSGIAVWSAGTAYKDAATARLNDTARTLANAIEGELDSRFANMSVLAQHRETPNAEPLPEPEQWALGASNNVALIPSDRVPVLRARSAAAADAALLAIRTQANVVSNVLTTGNEPRLVLAVPTPTGERGAAAFVMSTSPQELIQTLQRGKRALTDILVAVTDGNGRILARSRDADRFVGQVAPDWPRLEALGTSAGLFTAKTIEGVPIVLSFQKLAGTPGWVIIVGESTSVFDARWRDPMLKLLLGAGASVLLAVCAAIWLGGRILQPVQALARYSNAIADGKETDAAVVAPSSIREFETLRQSFARAECSLRNEKRRYRTIAETGAIVLWRRDGDGGAGLASGWEQLTGRPESEVEGQEWTSAIHPEDRPVTTAAWAAALAGSTSLDVEFRLKISDGRWLWVRSQGAPVLDQDGQIIEWVGLLEDIDERKRAQADIAHLAHHDTLTGLGNRTLFHQRLEQAAANTRLGLDSALLCLDLDLFKQVNDTLGHPVGDALLCAVADRLRGCAGNADCLVRLGGDEFAVIQSEGLQPDAAVSLGCRVVEALCAPYEIGGHQITIGASVGVTLIGDDSTDIDAYFKRADKALYRAKQDGRGRVCFHDQDEMLVGMAELAAKGKSQRQEHAREQPQMRS